jgi:phosphoribosylamine--glycine ligase
VGSGAREHALIRKFQAETQVDQVLAVGTNAGIAQEVEVLKPDFEEVRSTVDLIVPTKPDLVVIGPEAPLVAGLTDALRAAGVNTFGPSAQAARLESSKAFAKEVMAHAGVATARATYCESLEAVEGALASQVPPYVVKDDALAAGKGVLVTNDVLAAIEHARSVFLAGNKVLIEDFLPGKEASIFFICDGKSAVPLQPVRDHKRLLAGDRGPNTGGMGSYAPLSDFSLDQADALVDEIANPILVEMQRRGTPFVGVLYAGLMVDDSSNLDMTGITKNLSTAVKIGAQVKVVEFNVRFGDPETQSVLRLMDSPLSELLLSAARGDIDSAARPSWASAAAMTVVMAAAGYPERPITGAQISGLQRASQVPGVHIYHAGTKSSASTTDTRHDIATVSGGRVLSISALGADLAEARERAYQAVSSIDFDGAQYRDDIGLPLAPAVDASTAETIAK